MKSKMTYKEFIENGGKPEMVSSALTNWNKNLPFRIDMSECEQDGNKIGYCKGNCESCNLCVVVKA